MPQPYAAGTKARGFCDRCGFNYRLHTLKSEVIDTRVTGLLVCEECWDPDQPQLQLGRFPVSDPQALRNPRPAGLAGGRIVSGTLSYDFADGADGFVAENGSLATPSGSVVLSMSVSGSPALLSNSSTSIDTSLYRYVRMRVRFQTLIASPVQRYRFSWRRQGEVSDEVAIEASDVDLFVNGDQFHDLVWDTRDDNNINGVTSPWTGTVEIVRFQFLGNDPDSTSSVEVDWIRFEPGYLGQGS